jgi:hypothetical protein
MGFKLFGTEGGVQPRGFDEVEVVEDPDPTPEAEAVMKRLRKPKAEPIEDEVD